MSYRDRMLTKIVVNGATFPAPESNVIKSVFMPYGATLKAISKRGDAITVDGAAASAGMAFLPNAMLDGAFTSITVSVGGPVIAYIAPDNDAM